MSNEQSNLISHLGEFFSQPWQLTSDEPENVLDFTAVTSKARFEGLQNDLIRKLQKPTVILEFRGVQQKDIIRHEPITLFDDSDFPCTTLRRCTCKICHKLDSYYAELFKGLTKDTLKSDIAGRINDPNRKVPIKTKVEIKNPEFVSEGDGYLYYDCPITGYRETAFPIFFGDKILGVLFVGRIRIKSNEKFESACRKAFIKKSDGWKEYLSKERPDKNTRKFVENGFLSSRNHKNISNSNSSDRPLSEEEYQEVVKKSKEELKKFQNGLTGFLNDKMKEYVRLVTNKLMDEFYETNSNALPEFWLHVKKIVIRLSSFFKISNISVFGPDWSNNTHEVSDKPVMLKTVAFSNDVPDDYQLAVQLPGGASPFMKKHQYHTKSNNLLSIINSKNKVSEDTAFLFFPTSPNRQDSMALLLDISENSGKSPHDVFLEQREAFSEGLMPLFLFVFARLLALLNYLSHKQLDDTLQIYRHEVGSNIEGLDDVYDKFDLYLDNLPANEKYPDYLHNKNQDLKDIIVLLCNLTENARVVNGLLPDFSAEVFPLFRGILFKWKQTFLKDMLSKGQKLVIEDNDSPIRTDKSCLDQIVYNLIYNAHKYAHSGSTIYVYYDRIEEQSFGELTVTDYGIEITEDKEKPYRLFYRGDNTKDYQEGSGIGLFVSQQIATGRLRTKISHTCEKVSKYYVPFMEPYLEIDFPDESMEKKNDVREELRRLKRNGLYQEIVSDLEGPYGMPFTDEEINAKINKHTYKVSFRLEINDFR
jgi:uncharacterized FlaG/YvyC family protein